MKKGFFDRFEAGDKTVHKSISMGSSDWKLLEAYKLYGSSKSGHDISIQRLVREIIVGHIKSDREFAKSQGDWLGKLTSIDEAAKEASQ